MGTFDLNCKKKKKSKFRQNLTLTRQTQIIDC